VIKQTDVHPVATNIYFVHTHISLSSKSICIITGHNVRWTTDRLKADVRTNKNLQMARILVPLRPDTRLTVTTHLSEVLR
jgi:hypothetical protein